MNDERQPVSSNTPSQSNNTPRMVGREGCVSPILRLGEGQQSGPSGKCHSVFFIHPSRSILATLLQVSYGAGAIARVRCAAWLSKGRWRWCGFHRTIVSCPSRGRPVAAMRQPTLCRIPWWWWGHSRWMTTTNKTKPSPHERLAIVLTCNVCKTRMVKSFSKLAYETGVVIVCCPECENRHLIADNFGWFGSERNIEEIMNRMGREVRRVEDPTKPWTAEDMMGWESDEDVQAKLHAFEADLEEARRRTVDASTGDVTMTAEELRGFLRGLHVDVDTLEMVEEEEAEGAEQKADHT